MAMDTADIRIALVNDILKTMLTEAEKDVYKQ